MELVREVMERQKRRAVIETIETGNIDAVRVWAYRWGLSVHRDKRVVLVETARMAQEMELPKEIKDKARAICRAAGVRQTWRH